eukprot:13243.XXX_660502_659127_1 [CDS] Oithona nana genome sequencing.
MELQPIFRASVILTVFVAVFAQNSHYYNYYQHQGQLGNDYYNNYAGHYNTEAPSSESKSSNYLDHYGSKQSLYHQHNLTGYPQPGVIGSATAVTAHQHQPNEVNTDYYDYYYDYENSDQEPRQNVKKNDVIISPHPFVVAVQRMFTGLQADARQLDALGGLFTGNTIYLVLSVTLGIIGVGGLVYQFGSSFIDEFYKDIDDLKARVTALEGSTTSSSSTTTTVVVPQNVKDQITANCNEVLFCL